MYWSREETLGSGGFGFVSKAKTHQGNNHNLPAILAVKSAKVSESESLYKEKELLDQFKNCPCILHCFGDDNTTENGEQLYNILLEYASGGCLLDRIIQNGGGLPERLVKQYTKSILTALSHIHKKGYVHCDIKPHNVLLVNEEAKLADFGSATKISSQQESTIGFRGTVLYAAPESISREEYVLESDIWALGCTVLHMFTGKAPWKINKNDQAADVLFKIGCSDEIPEIPSDKKISKEAKDFLYKCLVKDPRSRSSAAMLLNHPFLKSHHHHLLSSTLHHIVPRCFHHSAAAVHAC